MNRKLKVQYLGNGWWNIWLLAIIVSANAATPAQSFDETNRFACEVTSLPTSWAFENHLGTIERHAVVFTENGNATPTLYFRNTQPRAITALALIVEYRDEGNRVIERVPISGSTAGSGLLHVPFALELTHTIPEWKQPLRQGDTVALGATKDGIRTGHCPTQAKVMFLMARLDDGTVRTFESPNWILGPMPRIVPELPRNFPPLPAVPPVLLLGNVAIDEHGKVTSLDVGDQGSSELRDWLERFMTQNWKFHPALRDGKPVPSVLKVAFRFPVAVRSPIPGEERILFPVTLIQFFPRQDIFPGPEDSHSPLVVMYGLLQENSAVE